MSQSGAPVGTAFVDILPKTDGFVASLTGQLKSAITQAAGGVDASPITKSLNAGLIALGGAAIAGIYKGIKATQDWVTEVQTLQRVTGQSAEGASTLAATADAMGVSVSSLSSAMTILSRNVATNSTGIQKYGIVTKDAAGNTLPMDQILGEIQTKFQSLPEGVDRTALATSLFGRAGRALIPVLGLSSDQMAEMADKAKSLGLVLSQNDVDAAQKLKIAQAELGDAFKGLQIQLGKVFIPILTTLTKAMTAAVEIFARVPVPIKVATVAFLGLNTAIVALRAGWGLVAKNFEALGVGITKSASNLDTATTAIDAQTAATDVNSTATINNIAANESSNATQVSTVESYNQAADALNAQTAATDINTTATAANATTTGVMAGQTQLAGLAFGELAGEEAVATGFTEVLTGALTDLWATLNAIEINLAGFLVPLGWAALIIAAVVAVTIIVVKNWDTIKRVTAEVWGGIVKALAPVIAAFKNIASQLGRTLAPYLKAVGEGFQEVWDQIVTAVSSAAAAIGPALQEIGSAIAEVLKALGPFGAEIAKLAVISVLVALFGPFVIALKVLAVVLQVVADAVKLMGDDFTFVFHYISVFVVGTINFVIDAINALIDAWNKLPFVKTIAPLNEVGQATTDVADSTNAAADAANNYADAQTRAGAADIYRRASADALATTLDKVPGATDKVSGATDIVSASFDDISHSINEFSNSSGVDLSQYKENLQKYISDPTSATLQDVRSNISGIKHAYSDWVKGIASSLADYGSVLDQFQNKNSVDLGKATNALTTYAGQLHKLGTDIQTLKDRYGKAATPFIQLLEQTGTAYLGLANSAVAANKKNGTAFLNGFKMVKTQAQITAEAMASALDTAFGKILREFRIMFNAILVQLGKPPAFDVNITPAQRALQTLDNNIETLTSKTRYITIQGQYVPPPNPPGGKDGHAAGGIIRAATGLIAHSPTLLVGEGHYPTPIAPGAEAVIPLNARGKRIMQEAFGSLGGGGAVVMPRATDLAGRVQITDWRRGILSMDAEVAWEDAVRDS